MGAYSREALIKKILFQHGRLFESGHKIEHLRYTLYIERRVLTSQTRIPFPAVKLGFHLSLLTITERYSHAAQSTMKSHFSVKSSIMNKVMDNVKLLK